jgi:ABC-2 type transport system permease protein
MNDFFAGVGLIVSLELRQRVRGLAWYVLLGGFVALIALVTVLLSIALGATQANAASGGAIFSTIIYFVLLLGTLVAPALGGNAINGDRDAGTLATTQVTLITTGQIVIGKFLAAWITALGFLAVSVPFLVYAALLGGLSGAAIVVSLLVLAVELGVVSAIGVGLSGVLNRPLFSIVATYLAVAALSIGTLIAFALGGTVVQSQQTITTSTAVAFDEQGHATSCAPGDTQITKVPRFDYFWGVLATNPYVLLADAVPTHFDSRGNVTDLFGSVKAAVRTVQIAPKSTISYDECGADASAGFTSGTQYPTARKLIESTVPGWAVELLIQLILAAAALVGAVARTRTPAGRLSRGSRIA